ncbi:mCG147494 [Mus musculus]|nr:mCG147494 [Mus musculus]
MVPQLSRTRQKVRRPPFLYELPLPNNLTVLTGPSRTRSFSPRLTPWSPLHLKRLQGILGKCHHPAAL